MKRLRVMGLVAPPIRLTESAREANPSSSVARRPTQEGRLVRHRSGKVCGAPVVYAKFAGDVPKRRERSRQTLLRTSRSERPWREPGGGSVETGGAAGWYRGASRWVLGGCIALLVS